MKIFITIIVFLTALSLNAQQGAKHYKKADEYYDKKDYRKAIIELDSALKLEPKNLEYLLLKGNAFDHLKNFQGAFDTYSLMLEIDSLNIIGLSQRGLLLNKIQEFEYALKDFDKALRIEKADTSKLSLYINRGAVKINIRDFTGAYEDFISAYKIDSLDIGVLNNLASVCDDVGRADQTLVYLNRIIQLDSTFIGAYVNIGFKYQDMGDYKRAISYFDKVLKMEPDEPLSFSNRAFNKYKLGDYAGALTDVNKSLSLYNTNSYAYRTRALIYLAQKKNENACADLQKAIELGFTTMYGDEVEQLQLKNCKRGVNSKL